MSHGAVRCDMVQCGAVGVSQMTLTKGMVD